MTTGRHRYPVAAQRQRALRPPPRSAPIASFTHPSIPELVAALRRLVARRQPRLGIDRAAVAAQLEIKHAVGAPLRGVRHDAYRLACQDPLADRNLSPAQPGEQRMISVPVPNYQDHPVGAEWSGIDDPAIEWRDHRGRRDR